MIAASAFDPIGIRGRYAFGVACLAQVCAAWHWSTPPLDQLTTTLWAYTSAEHPATWEAATTPIRSCEPARFAQLLELADGDSERIQVLHHLVNEICDIGSADLYATVHSWRSLLHTMNVVGILVRLGMPLPSLAPFQVCRFQDRGGWGEPLRAEE
jgi:hypothetical protein